MANLIVENNLQHLIERTKQRFGSGEEKAKKFLEMVKKILEAHSIKFEIASGEPLPVWPS